MKRQSGFTLIELVIVVGIIAIISVIAIGKFTDIRVDAARKANVANLKNITRTINTELARLDGTKPLGMFAYVESLVDSAEGGGDPRGAEGTYLCRDSWYDGNGGVVPGIYCGIKRTGLMTNAGGVGTGEIAAIADAHEDNVGLESLATATRSRGTTTPAKLCLYYLTEADATALAERSMAISRNMLAGTDREQDTQELQQLIDKANDYYGSRDMRDDFAIALNAKIAQGVSDIAREVRTEKPDSTR